jgi:signal peptidase I
MNDCISPRKPLLATVMSLVLPGFGQLYNGEPNKAIWLFLSFALISVPGVAFIALYLPAAAMLPALVLGLLLALGIWLYGAIDAWRGARCAQAYTPRAWQVSGMYLLVLVLCSVFALPLLIGYVRHHQVSAFRIPSSSMEPSVLKGDFIFADKRYNCPECKRSVQRGDVAIFTYPNDRTLYYIKRIIGLPGDRVQIKGDEIWLNGKSLKVQEAKTAVGAIVTESIGIRQWQVNWAAPDRNQLGAELTVPPGHVFVLGDNRSATVDSRAFGTVPLQDVIGKARQIWFSFDGGRLRWDRLGAVVD